MCIISSPGSNTKKSILLLAKAKKWQVLKKLRDPRRSTRLSLRRARTPGSSRRPHLVIIIRAFFRAFGHMSFAMDGWITDDCHTVYAVTSVTVKVSDFYCHHRLWQTCTFLQVAEPVIIQQTWMSECCTARIGCQEENLGACECVHVCNVDISGSGDAWRPRGLPGTMASCCSVRPRW